MTVLVELLIRRHVISLLRASAVLLTGARATLVVHNGLAVDSATRRVLPTS